MDRIITLTDLKVSIAKLTQCTEADAETFLRELFQLAYERIETDGEAEIPGLGRFRLSDETVVYAPDPAIAEAINAPFAAFEAVELPADYVDNPAAEEMPEPKPAPEPEPEKEEEEEIARSAEFEEEADAEPEPLPEPLPEPEEEPQSEEAPRRRSWGWIAWLAACMVCFAAGWYVGRLTPAESEPAEPAATATEAPAPEPQQEEQEPEPEPEPLPEPEEEPEPAREPVYDTIASNRYLTTMARAHYNQMEYWVYIYEENAGKLGHPDRLDSGTVVVIPPAEKYGLIPGDETKISEAKRIATEIYARFN